MADEPRSIRVEAIVLSHREMGEADRLLVLYTRERGKLRAIVKGARKLNSRKAGHLQPFSQVKVMLARGHDLWIVTQAELIDAFLPLQQDLQRVAYGAYAIELLDRFSYEEGANLAIYTLLLHTLRQVAESQYPEKVLRYYDLRMLDHLGFRPQLQQCAACGGKVKAEDQYFSSSLGGVLCPRCGHGQTDARQVAVRVLKYLRHYQRSSYREAMRAPYVAEVLQAMDGLLQGYFYYLLERRLNTPDFISRLRQDL